MSNIGTHDPAIQLVPAADSAANVRSSDVIGNKGDTHAGNSIYALLEATAEHFHSAGKCYPTGAGGVTATANAAAWTLGAFVEVVPVSTITSDFDIHWLVFEGVSAAQVYEIVLYAATTEIWRGRVKVEALGQLAVVPDKRVQTAIQAANAQIQCKIMTDSTNADTVTVSLEYHEY